MLELERILVIIENGTDYQPALEKAVQLAKFADSELDLLIADYSSYLADGKYFDPIEAQKLRRLSAAKQKEKLDSLARPLREQGLRIHVNVSWGNPPYEKIIHHIEDTQPSLVVKATRQHKQLARLFLSNEDWELVRYCPVPLLLAKGKRWGANPVLVAAVDPSHTHNKPADLDQQIVSSAKALADISAGSVHLYHSTWLPPLSGLYPVMLDSPSTESRLQEMAEIHAVCPDQCHESEREVEHSLPLLSESLNASAVVMGAISRSRLDRLVIGNTAEKVLDYLECDVLVIKPDVEEAAAAIAV